MRKLIKQNNIVIGDFKDIKKAEIAYFLGFLWADGHLPKNNNQISFSISGKDSDELIKCLNYAKIDFKNKIEKHPNYPDKTIAYFRIINKDYYF